jgi:hypothetical protein
LEIVLAEEKDGGLVPADYNDVMFFCEKWSPRNWQDYMEIPYAIWLKMQEYSQARAEAQKAKNKQPKT